MNEKSKNQNYSKIIINIVYQNRIHTKEFETDYMVVDKGKKVILASILPIDRTITFALWLDILYEKESSDEIPSYDYGEGIFTKNVGAYIDKLHTEAFEVFNFKIQKDLEGRTMSLIELKYRNYKL